MLDELFDKLTPLIEKRNKDSYFECRILQVKEKYGSLRVYMSLETDEMSRLIEEAEEKSATTCELCGNEGGLRIRNGWYMTHCNECHGEKDESN